MAVNKQIKLHELVVPTDPLPVWYFIFHDAQFSSYVAPHWHRDIELSFTLNGSISDFRIGKRDYTTKAGQILVVNTQVIHCVDPPKNNIIRVFRSFSHLIMLKIFIQTLVIKKLISMIQRN
ncbi:AraC family ligand binding domain-containing protein [Lactobacillus amylolyticus]|uniref:AraC family ligand binding domain-containing protein n=1 Tax=Lactobacillus amylolyticus TaxID=83683 RepID=UPI001F4937FD|nr:AraC family ligand binding domain-containing protein [Lactobacillus amylolyticus]